MSEELELVGVSPISTYIYKRIKEEVLCEYIKSVVLSHFYLIYTNSVPLLNVH